MKATVRRWHSQIEEIEYEGGRRVDPPHRRVIVAAVVANPYAGQWQDDLSELIDLGEQLSAELTARAQALLGNPVRAFGKAAIVGSAGEIEHVSAVVHPRFGQPLRAATDGAALLQSIKKRGGPGTVVDVPLSHYRDMAVRSHFDSTSVMVPDAPLPDEMVIALAVADGPRAHQRIGGKTEADLTNAPKEQS
ncbi:amino acid synthesis family protein [Epidermidibacterium keratini]|uniref:Amino acid synthesis family protein n=1 Tax=Epidermidibacterium keratini TaxID=1891644 RepID=A0A7L4YM85_9ACTN|nr:amino acid synthesis family protein [Epidermidibacterium keratini]QHB99928.1 amino acid synthesis family protein [Epidermidibacterium keratini]